MLVIECVTLVTKSEEEVSPSSIYWKVCLKTIPMQNKPPKMLFGIPSPVFWSSYTLNKYVKLYRYIFCLDSVFCF